MQFAPHVQDLIELLGNDVLLLPWALGTKGGKRKWKHLTVEAMSDLAYLRRLSEGNIGVALGRVSGGLCSVDIDSDEAIEEFLTLNPAFGNTLRSRGRRGGNLWVRAVGDYPPLTPLKRFSLGWGEWRSTGGQTIIHGEHPDGGNYQIVNRVKPIKIEMIQIKWPEGIYPLLQGGLHQGGSMGSVTERSEPTEPTELAERTEPSESSERKEVNGSGNVFCAVVSMITNHDEAVTASLPKEIHQNHDCLFQLARAVKAFALHQKREVPLTEMKQIFLKWHSKAMVFLDPAQNQDDYWLEFLDAHDRAEHPLGIDVIAVAWKNAQGKTPPPAAEIFATDEMRRLIVFCQELQSLCKDKPFFLSTRSVQRLFGHSNPMTASRWLRGLCQAKILKVHEQGKQGGGRATRFFYLPPL